MADPSAMILAGGTGGHVYPALAVAEGLCARGWRVEWLGSRSGIEARLVPAAGITLHLVSVSGLRGKGLGTRLAAPAMLLAALIQSAAVIARRRPGLVLGMGGFVSGPAGVAAWLLRRPLVIHEQNAIAGLTNRWLARLARRVLEGFPGSFPGAVAALTTGNPVRRAIAAVPAPRARCVEPRPDRLRVLVLGGSQGADALNALMPAVARSPASPRLALRHQCGERHLAATRSRYAGIEEVEILAYIEDIAAAFGWADVVVARSGAMTVSELAAAGVASILVPFPHAVDDHQSANARFLADAGAAVIVAATEATPVRVAGELARLAADRDALLAMSEAARVRGTADAAERVIAICEEVLDAA